MYVHGNTEDVFLSRSTEYHLYRVCLPHSSLFFSYPSISRSTVCLQALVRNKIPCLYFTDLYFLTLINRIYVIVKKNSLAILDKEFVHLFTHIAHDCQTGFSKHFCEIMVGFMETRIVHPWRCNCEIHLCFPLHLSSLLTENSHKILWFPSCMHSGLKKKIIEVFSTASPLISLFSLR